MVVAEEISPPLSRTPQSRMPEPPADLGRDRFIDVIRVVAVVAIVAQHWLMPVLSYNDGVLSTGNAFATPGLWPVTWLSQVMPLIFFAGGAAATYSFRRARVDTATWLGRRLHRLTLPVIPLLLVWLPLPHLLIAVGVPDQPVEVASALAGRLLWFLAVYVLLTVATPLLYTAHRRLHGGEIAVLVAVTALVDAMRFAGLDGAPAAGYVNVAAVWGAIYAVGIAYAERRSTRWGPARPGTQAPDAGHGGHPDRRRAGSYPSPLRGGLFALSGLVLTAFAVVAGPYPGSMIGMPGEPLSNMNPPTLVLLGIAALQIGLAFALRPVLDQWAHHPPVARGLQWLSARLMTIYVWHMPALLVVGGLAVLVLGWSTPDVLSAAWRQDIQAWLASLVLVLVVFLRFFSRAEYTPAPRRVSAWQVTTATLLIGPALGVISAVGFTPGTAWPTVASATIVLGVVSLSAASSGQAPGRRTRSPAEAVGLAPPEEHQPTGSPQQLAREKLGT